MRMKIWTPVLLSIILLSTAALSESSLSALGYGLQRPNASVRAAGMGMVSLAVPDTLGLNLFSPAMWEGSRTARFAMQGRYASAMTEDAVGSDVSDVAEISGFAFALPIYSKWFIGMTFSPYTRMDYHWESAGSNEWTSTMQTQDGLGGISQGLVQMSMPADERLRIGFGARFLLGQVRRTWDVTFPGTVANPATSDITENLRGMGLALSTRWDAPAGWTVGSYVYGPTSLGVKRHSFITAIRQLSANRGIVDTLENSTVERKKDYEVPWDIGVGVSRRLGLHIVGVEMSWQGWDFVDEPSDLVDKLRNALRLSAGWEWQPVHKPFDPFWKALAYRGGLYMQDHYVVSDGGNQARKFGLTTGISIPYSDNRSRIDLALEFGMMGDQDKDGVSENSIGLSVGFSHSELWFVSRRERKK